MPRGGSFVAADGSRAATLARYYDLDLEDHRDDVELYLALIGRGHSAVLELGCGTGRVALPLAAAGHEVVGVDNDPAMLSRARAAWEVGAPTSRRGSLDLIDEDLTKLDLGRQFDLVILGLNALPMLASRDAQQAALRVAAAHLEREGGRVVVDVWLPDAADLAAYDGSLELAWQRRDPETGDELAKLWSAEFDAATSTAVITTFFDSWAASGGEVHRVARRDILALIGASELEMLVEKAGLKVQTRGGDYSMSEFGPGSERVVLVCGLL